MSGVQYAKFWQKKLDENKDLDFPDKLCDKISEITDKFSFAYMQEAFVASLLAIAAREGKDINDTERESERWAGPLDPMTIANQQAFIDRVDNEGQEPDVEKLELWIEIQKQVKILREEMEEENLSRSSKPIMPPHPSERGMKPLKFGNEVDVALHGGKRILSSYERLRG